MLANIFLAGIGGFIGSTFRYVLSACIQNMSSPSSLPYGTLGVNISGCLVIGFLGGYIEHRDFLSPEIRTFLLVGVLGGFTTFSTFGYGQLVIAFSNVMLQILLGLGAVWVGYMLSDLP
ncbi:MAG: fluoride efflux transporter CrcB [Kiritimatiellae bacterium]|nr:fluoride efflux transporter CrcB [Kiritimatiellia bacterium]